MTLIDKYHWYTCKICGAKILDLAKEFGGNGVYYAQVFRRHMRMCHQDISLEEYFVKYCGIPQPICNCGICKQQVKVIGRTSLRWAQYACGRNTGVQTHHK